MAGELEFVARLRDQASRQAEQLKRNLQGVRRDASKPINIAVGVDAKAAQQTLTGLDRDLAKLQSRRTQLPLELQRVDGQIGALTSQLQALQSRRTTLPVELQGEADRQIRAVKAELSGLERRRVRIPLEIANVGAGIGTIEAEIGRVRASLAGLDAAVPAGFLGRLRASMRGVQGDLDALTERARNTRGAFASALGGPGGMIMLAGMLAGALSPAVGAVALLPGVAIAAGAAMGTLKLGMMGVTDAISEQNPAKYAEALGKLAPAARDSVTAIRDMQPAFQGLRLDVQGALFKDLAGTIRGVVASGLPVLRTGLVGIATEFNTIAQRVGAFLQQRDTLVDVGTIFANVRTAVANLGGAVRPLLQAFRDLGVVGSEFLPGLASGAARAAEGFARLVARARETGQLREFIQTGLTALRDLGTVIAAVVRGVTGSAAPFGVMSGALGFLARNADAVTAVLKVLLPTMFAYRGVLLVIATQQAAVTAGLAAYTAATKVAAAAQGLLNIALRANPIGIIVTALGLLATGLVVAWRNSERFRDTVKTAFAGVGLFVADVADKFAGLLEKLADVPGFGWVRPAAESLRGFAGTARDSATQALASAAANDEANESHRRTPSFVDPATGAIEDANRAHGATPGVVDAARTALDQLKAAEGRVKTETEAAITQLNIFKGAAGDTTAASDGWKAALDRVRESVKQHGRSLDDNTEKGRANREAIRNAATALQAKMEADFKAKVATGDLTGATRDATTTFEKNRQKLIDVAVQSGLTKREAEKYVGQLLKTPDEVKTAVNTPGMSAAQTEVRNLQEQLKALNLTRANPQIDIRTATSITRQDEALARRRATGGPVWGPGTATSDSIPARLSNGEYVVQARSVQKYGLGFLNAVNKGRYALGGLVQKFQAGGVVRPRIDIDTDAHGTGQAYAQARAELIRIARGVVAEDRAAAAGGAPGGGAAFTGGLKGRRGAYGGVLAHVAAVGDAVRKTFGNMTVGGFVRRNIKGTGRVSDHGLGKALDFMTYRDKAKGNRIAAFLVRNRQQFRSDNVIFNDRIWSAGRGTWKVYRHPSGSNNDTLQHRDHVHYDTFRHGGAVRALKQRGGALNPHIRDRGGPLLPGYTLNATGRPETVIPGNGTMTVRHVVEFRGAAPPGLTARDVADVIARDPRAAAALERTLGNERNRASRRSAVARGAA